MASIPQEEEIMAGSLSGRMVEFMERASWIRRMFEEGARLKREHGEDAVCDLSLGNPDLPPPAAFQEALVEAAEVVAPGIHGYMPNAGLPEVRERVARVVARDHGVPCTGDHILLTCGAAGGLNIIFKAILNPGEEVVVPRPYFVEYGFYVDNHGGRLVPVDSGPDFTLDLEALEAAITPATKAVLINSPNNPSGAVYPREQLEALGRLLRRRSQELGRTIFLVADEPYRRLTFDGVSVPPVLAHYDASLVATSFSKDLSIPGERIGYVAVNPRSPELEPLLGALTLANRILGFVNAPALMQRVIAHCLESCVDVERYQRRRDLLASILQEAGYRFTMPKGAFYLFPESPLESDVEFVRILQEELILAVPGSGFGQPGHFRLAFCVDEEVIERSRQGFIRAMERCR